LKAKQHYDKTILMGFLCLTDWLRWGFYWFSPFSLGLVIKGAGAFDEGGSAIHRPVTVVFRVFAMPLAKMLCCID
jgi:hypothetical protein